MTAPIRIRYLENADHFMEAQTQSPPAVGRQIPERTQRIIMGAVVVIAFIVGLGKEYHDGHDLKLVILAGAFVAAIMLFWSWFFKKLGLNKNTHFQDYRWTKKDRDRFERYYNKRGGDDASSVVCELDDTGVRFNPGDPKSRAYQWNEIVRAIERPKGLFLYKNSWMYFWLPRAGFASKAEYQSTLEVIGARLKLERLNLPGMAFVALGTNLGDRVETLQTAFQQLREISEYPMLKSSFWETTPVDCPPNSPMFLNAAVAITPKSGETPESLLAKLLQMEKKFGRRPKQVLNEPRPLDLDLIAFRDETRATPDLTLPHPRAHLRRFVLEPLAEIGPDLVLPGQARTVAELLAQLTSAENVRRL
jgi:2-amino-4-hydroxy-6-hydroxymethyldihydropteridine diphosphokinase